MTYSNMDKKTKITIGTLLSIGALIGMLYAGSSKMLDIAITAGDNRYVQHEQFDQKIDAKFWENTDADFKNQIDRYYWIKRDRALTEEDQRNLEYYEHQRSEHQRNR